MYKKEHKHKKFRYIEEVDRARIVHGKPKPEYLFKYYALSEYSVDALVNGYFYASHPFDLNDVLDSSQFLLYTSKPIDFRIYESFLGNIEEFRNDKDELIKLYNKDTKRENACRYFIDSFWQIGTDKFGLISVAGNGKSTLMWPHYTQERGFQLKFRGSDVEASIQANLGTGTYVGLYPVNYSKKLRQIDVSEYENWYVPLYYATNIKSKRWKYEDEWRFIISRTEMGIPFSKKAFSPRGDALGVEGSRNVSYDRRLIKEVVFGMDYFLGTDFTTERENNRKILTIKKKPDISNYKLHKRLLSYLANDFKGEIYLPVISPLNDHKKAPVLVRRKMQIMLEQISEDSFLLTHTDHVVPL